MPYEIMNPYVPVTDFSDDEANQTGGRAPVDTSGLDAELAALQTLTDAFKSNIDLAVRSDGRIKDRFVETHGLHPDIYKDIASNIDVITATGALILPVIDTGSADAIVGDMTPAPASYFNGLVVLVLMNASVTGGPVTANINGLGTTPVKQADGITDPAAGELQINGYAFLIHDGTSFQHINKTTSSGSISAHLVDLANPHVVTKAQLGIVEGDPTDSNATRDKVFSNNDIKLVNDYRLVTHLPLAGGTVSGAVTLSGPNTFSGLSGFTDTLSMTAAQFRGAYEASVASASTVDLSAVLGNSLIVTGNVTINSFGTVQAGTAFDVEVSGGPTISDNANIILPTSGAISCNPGDTFRLVSRGGGVFKMFNFDRKDGSALTAPVGNQPTGACSPFIGVTAPSGYVLAEGGTIGNAISSASVRANADTKNLFELFWNSMANAEAPVSTGRGGNAEDDFNANKNIVITDLRKSAPFGTGGVLPAIHGKAFGAEDHTLSVPELAEHDHTMGRVAGGNGNLQFSAGAGMADIAPDTGLKGGGLAHNNMPPGVALRYIIKL